MKWFLNFTLVVLVLISSYASKAQGQVLKPNIIFILADDLGYGDVQSLNPNSKIPTPHLNTLAEEGLSFTNAHATSSVCTPSRYSFLTGAYPWRSRMKKGVCWVWDPPLIDEDRFTIGEMLQKQGYSTACIGKWHLGWNWQTQDGKPVNHQNEGRNVDYHKTIMNGPITRGFDYYFGQDTPSLPPHVLVENDRVVEQPTDWLATQGGMPGAMAPGWKYENLMQTITDKASQYITEQTIKNPEEPFFLYLPLSAPHTPIAPQGQFVGKTPVDRYGDFVYEMDYHIGQVLKLVDSLGIADNTLIIFTSDNGGVNEEGNEYMGAIGSLLKYGHNSNGMLRGMKSDAWEGGHRVPFIVRWPGHIEPNTASDALVSQVDMMATFAALTGAKLPEGAAEDSYNILPLLKDPSSENSRKALVTQSGNGILAIQQGDWKLILSSGGGGSWTYPKGELPVLVSKGADQIWDNVQLYNIKNDPTEIQNVANNHHNEVKILMALLKEYVLSGRSHPARSEAWLSLNELWAEVGWIKEVDNGK